MNLTLKLLRAIGSPFVSARDLPESDSEASELYHCATKNKIGLLYLEALKDGGKLEEFQLKSEYEEEWEKHNDQLITLNRVSVLFNSFGINYAIFKSIMPFPATPNDVDILHFGSDAEYEKAVEIMLKSSYMEVEGPVDSSQRMFHDTKHGGYPYPHSHQKDVYDIDLYQKAAASYLIYLDKKKLAKHMIQMDMGESHLRVLKPEAELITIITHSIIPEQLFTLSVYYATLHYLVNMTPEEIDRFINLARENKVTFAAKADCSLTAELHKAAHGFIPRKNADVLARLGSETNERKNLIRNNYMTPHRYSWSALIKTLLEKSKEKGFRRSVARQAISMLNPKLARWVVSNITWRRRRETY